MTTPKLQLPELVVGQAGKELTHNQALAILSQLTQANVVDKDLTAPPGSTTDGAMYIVAASATGAWSGKSGQLAFWLTSVGAWTFAAPVNGWSVWVADEAAQYTLIGGAWTIGSGGGGGMTNPMTTAGDLIVGGASGAPTRLEKGTDGQVLKMVSGAQAWADGSAIAEPSALVTDATTARTFGLADAGKYMRFTSAATVAATVPPQASVGWAADQEINIRRHGAGLLTLTPGAGVTLNAPSGGTLAMTDRMSVTLKRVAPDVWDVIGQTVAA